MANTKGTKATPLPTAFNASMMRGEGIMFESEVCVLIGGLCSQQYLRSSLRMVCQL